MSNLSAFARPERVRLLLRALTVVLVTIAMLVTGGISPASAAPPRAVKNTPTLSYGEYGTAVKWVQRKLDVRPTSGYFGPKTRAAVKRFQGRHDIPRTGVVANRTWRALGVKPSKASASRSEAKPARTSSTSTARDAKVLAIAARQKGKPYRYGARGPGAWITVYSNPGHAYTVIAGLRLDTSSAGAGGGKGPRWRAKGRPSAGYRVRHPRGF